MRQRFIKTQHPAIVKIQVNQLKCETEVHPAIVKIQVNQLKCETEVHPAIVKIQVNQLKCETEVHQDTAPCYCQDTGKSVKM